MPMTTAPFTTKKSSPVNRMAWEVKKSRNFFLEPE